jgi:hypothetical protein
MRASSGACISVVSPPSGSIRRMEGFVEIIALCEQSFAFGTQMCTCLFFSLFFFTHSIGGYAALTMGYVYNAATRHAPLTANAVNGDSLAGQCYAGAPSMAIL